MISEHIPRGTDSAGAVTLAGRPHRVLAALLRPCGAPPASEFLPEPPVRCRMGALGPSSPTDRPDGNIRDNVSSLLGTYQTRRVGSY